MNFKLKDAIQVGVYCALYFIFLCIGTLLSVFVEHSGSMQFAPALTGLVAGTVYMVYLQRSQKFGMITLLGAVMSLFFLFSGYFALSFLPNLLCGFLADLVAKIGKYQSKLTNLLSYVVFSFGNLGPIYMMWLMHDAYVQRLVDRGKDAAYISRVMIDFNAWTVSYLSLSIILGALVGGLFGYYMLNKHFMKAGLVQNEK